MAETKAARTKRAFKNVFDPNNKEAMAVLDHLLGVLSVTRYDGYDDHDLLVRADERRRIGFSILRYLNLDERSIQEKAIDNLEERLYSNE